MNALRIALCSVLFLIATAPLMAQGTYTQIDVPGSTYTEADGINTQGDISGCYSDAMGLHGFLLSGGAYTTIDYPGLPIGTCMKGLNDFDQIVGEQEFTPFPDFIYNASTQTFTDISCPDFTNTVAAINNSGAIAGSVRVGQSLAGLKAFGSKCLDLTPPSSQGDGIYGTGISQSGDIVGWVVNAGGTVLWNFLYSRGKYRKIVIPVPSPVVEGINPAGTAVVGHYATGTSTTAGFLWQNRVLTSLMFPASSSTLALGINSMGQIVGLFFEANGVGHGFTWMPSAVAPKP